MDSQAARQFEIVEFGPYRIIGASCVGKNENREVPELWEREFMPRMGEIQKPGTYAGFGVCRCVPGFTDGTFEYIAAVEANADAPEPEGMMAVEIPHGEYAEFPVPHLSEIKHAWRSAAEALGASADWEAYCGPAGCECAAHPCFEYYPPDFENDDPLFVYIPVRRKAA